MNLQVSFQQGMRGLTQSRKTGIAVLIASGVLTLVGCGVSTQDSSDGNKSFKVADPAATCLESALPVVQDYFQGNARAQEVGEAWDCVGSALNMFTEFTRGSRSDSYTTGELRSFLQAYFLKDTKISDELLLEVMRIKQAILGGAADRISRTELARTQDILKIFKAETIRLLPHIKIVLLKEEVSSMSADPQKVEAALVAFDATLKNLGQLLGKSNQPYELRFVTNLMNEFGKLMPEWDGPEFVARYIPAVSAVKAFLIRPQGEVLLPSEWSEFLVNASRLYQLYMRYHYLLADRDLLTGSGLDHMTATLNEVFDILQGSIQAKPEKVIRYADIDPLIDEVVRLDLLPANIRPDTVKSLLRTAFAKIFNAPIATGSVLKRPEVVGLDERVFAALKEQAFGWLDMQRVWRQVVADAVKADPKLKDKPIPIKTIRALWPKVSTKYKGSHQDLETIFNREFPPVFNEAGAIVLDRNAANLGFDQTAFNSLNWKAIFIRLVSMGWSPDPARFRYAGLTKPEFGDFFYDLRAFAVDMELIEKDDETLWDTSFDESNMFMLSADANDRLNYNEGVDFISYTLSSSVMVGEMYNDVRKLCKEMGRDGFNLPTVEAQCFRARMKQRFDDVYIYLPTWVALAKKLGNDGFEKMEKGLEIAARENGYSNDFVTRSDITRMTMVMHYIESIFVRFDADKSGTISYQESRNAFFLFEGILTEIAKKEGITKRDEIFAIYTYILRYGHPPESLTDKIFFKLFWQGSESRYKKINADRMLLLEIVGVLQAQ